MISFLRPELMALALPLAWMAWTTRRLQHPVTTGLRLLIACLVALTLAGPYLRTGSSERHAVFLVDRSESMPAGSDSQAIELIDLALKNRQDGDRVHVVTFGQDVGIEPGMTAGSRGFQAFERSVSADGSDLAGGIETALSLIPEGGRGSIVVLSDGFAESAPAVDAATLVAAGRDVRIDVREVGRANISDTSVERLELPAEVYAGEPFFVTAWVVSDAAVTREVRLLRDGAPIESRLVALPKGRTRLRFRQRVDQGGIGAYVVELGQVQGASVAPGAVDRTPENDAALAATRIEGARPVLVVNHDGGADTLVLALRGAGIPAVAVPVEAAPRTLSALESFRAVVLENVPAARLGLERMELLRSWTMDHGGGLLMTGGQASFGSGGYFRSPLDELLPVSMEQRREHRKLAVALSVTLDRSGSMGANVAGGTKMDLANRGTVEALRLLSHNDSASVIAVDSSPHVIVSQQTLEDREDVERSVLGITAGGGGIFTAVALRACARQLQDAPQTTKHVILFADAADAEQYDETPAEIKLLRDMGATVSVIGLGSESDVDADFLKRCAVQGGGEAYFTRSASELPRLFAMDTQAVARSTFVPDPTGVKSRPELFGLGEIDSAPFPDIAGYNLSYLREGASLGAVTTDDYSAPIFAFHSRGLGRVAAFTGQIGGSAGAEIAAWDGFASFFVTVCRWLSGVEAPAGVFSSVTREGRDAVLTVEFDEAFDRTALGEELVATVGGLEGKSTRIALERIDETRFQARYPLQANEIALSTVSVGGGGGGQTPVPLPPIALPYSPEFERVPDPRAGERLLRRTASRSKGVTNVAVADIFRGARGVRSWRLFTRELMVLALLLWLVEIAGRRLALWSSIPALRKSRLPAKARSVQEPGTAVAGSPARTRTTEWPETGDAESAPGPGPSEEGSLGGALARARRSAGDRLDRS